MGPRRLRKKHYLTNMLWILLYQINKLGQTWRERERDVRSV